jgi:hypothetical protein
LIAGRSIGANGTQFLTGDALTSKRHVEAAQRMVELKGGLEALGLNGFLKQLVVWFATDPVFENVSYGEPIAEFWV